MKKYSYIIFITMFFSICFSQKVIPISSFDEIGEGSFVYENESGDGGYNFLPHIDTKVDLKIKGMVVNATVDQMFTNNTNMPIEAVYVFPLSTNAAVNDMKMIIDNRIIQGVVKEKEEAKKVYDQAKKEGKRTTLTTQNRPNIFTNKLANIMPGDTIVVRLSYVEDIHYDNEKFSLRFPLVVAPRYISGSTIKGYSGSGWSYDTDIVPDASEVSPPLIPEGMRTGNSILISTEIDAGLEIDKVKSPSHDIVVKGNKNKKYKINLKRSDYIPNKDFVLEYNVKKGKDPKAALFVNTVKDNENKDENYFMLMVVPPYEQNNDINIDKEIIFVVDVSGSMSGTSIEQAKESLKYSISKLKNGDAFNIIAYSNTFFSLSKDPILFNEDSLSLAKNFISKLKASGGTEAGPPLLHAMHMNSDNSRVKMIVFITDGAIAHENKILPLVESNLGKSRLFSVGIGSAPNSYLLEKIADKGRGSFTYINEVNNVSNIMNELFHKIEMPVLTDIKLNIDGKTDIYPNPVPDLFAHEPLVIFGKVDNNNDRQISISGKNVNGYFDLKIPINFSTGVENNAIGDIWARKKIDKLMDNLELISRRLSSDSYEDIKSDIIDLSIKHQLLSKFTSFVAVENKVVNPNGNSILANVPVDIPEGWDYDHLFSNSSLMVNNIKKNNIDMYAANNFKKMPQTATSMPVNFIIGVMLIFSSIIMYYFYTIKTNDSQ